MKDITTEEAVQTLKDFSKYGLYHNDNTKHNTVKAIEKVLNELESEKEYHQWDVEKLQDYHKGNSELNTKCVQLEWQLEKKNKIIDAMTEYIEEINYIDIDDNECEFETRHQIECPPTSCKDCIKQYFESEVANEERNNQETS